MTLNIKDPEAHRLAQMIAEEMGKTMTHAVTQALRERLERLNRQRKSAATAEELLLIGARCAATLEDRPPVDHGTLLYDERGVPR